MIKKGICFDSFLPNRACHSQISCSLKGRGRLNSSTSDLVMSPVSYGWEQQGPRHEKTEPLTKKLDSDMKEVRYPETDI